MLTLKEKILLYLLEHSKSKEIYWNKYFSKDITQEGIAYALDTARGLVSRGIDDLVKEQLLDKKISNVKHAKRKLYVYFLTEKGAKEAEQIKLSAGDIEFKTISKQKYIEFTSDMPKYKSFFGREKDIEILQNFVNSKSYKILYLKGIAGIGKTSFLTNFVSNYHREKSNIFWYRFYEWSTLGYFINVLSNFFVQLNRNELSTYLKSATKIEIDEITNIFKKDTEDIDILFILDDFHYINKEILFFFKSIMNVIKKTDNLKFIMCGRRCVKFYSFADKIIRKNVFEYQLFGLDYESSVNLLKTRNIMKNLDTIYTLTKGHPLCLELIDETGENITDLVEYLHDEIISTLSDKEKEILSFSSVFRIPIHRKALFYLNENINYGYINSLINKSLLIETNSKLDVHVLIKSLILSTVSPKVIKNIHITAAKYYLDTEPKDEKTYIEIIYHLVSGDGYKQALKILKEKKEHLLKYDWKKSITDIFTKKDIPENIKLEVSEIVG